MAYYILMTFLMILLYYCFLLLFWAVFNLLREISTEFDDKDLRNNTMRVTDKVCIVITKLALTPLKPFAWLINFLGKRLHDQEERDKQSLIIVV